MMQRNFTFGVTTKLQGNADEMLVYFTIPSNYINATGKKICCQKKKHQAIKTYN
jgi:hypothetical protein